MLTGKVFLPYFLVTKNVMIYSSTKIKRFDITVCLLIAKYYLIALFEINLPKIIKDHALLLLKLIFYACAAIFIYKKILTRFFHLDLSFLI